jgi:hypothetical protein
VNQLIVTLSELANENLPNNWLFVFTLEQSQYDGSYVYAIQLEDTSPSVIRYNHFALEEGVDVTFKFNGDYKYECYQMPDAISINPLDGELVETGKMRLLPQEEVIPTYVVSTNTYIYDKTNI